MINETSLSRFEEQLRFIFEVDKLKKVIRQTLLLDASRQENDAEHSWHMSLAILLLSEHANAQDIDLVKCVKMALIHDVVEIDAGDTFAYDIKGYEDKMEREQKAAARIFGLLPEDQREEYINLWNEFEEGITAEALFVGAIDKFMPVMHNYLTSGKQWNKHGVSGDMVLKRNAPMEKGSFLLWDYVQQIVGDAIKNGMFKNK